MQARTPVIAVARILRHAWRLGRKVVRAMRADHCPLPLPSFAYLNGEGDMARLHRACQRLDVSRCVTAASWVRLLISTLSWPGSAFMGSVARAVRQGGDGARRYHVPRWRQVGQSYKAAMRHNMNARLFYDFDLFRPDAPSPGSFIMPHELRIIADVLSATSMSPDITDRVAFLRRCDELGLPCVPVLARFDPDGTVAWAEDALQQAQGRDLYLKPADWDDGLCGELWQWRSGQGCWLRHGNRVTLDDIGARARDLSAGRTMLLQPFEPAHPVLRPLGLLGSCSVRCFTLAAIGGEPELVAALTRIPGGWWRAECGPEYGLTARVVDLRTGELGDGVKSRSPQRWKRHPETGEVIAGLRLPLWDEARALATEAHRLMPDYPVMSWDIVIGTDTLRLLGGSPAPRIDTARFPAGEGMNDERFANFILAHCERLGAVAAVH